MKLKEIFVRDNNLFILLVFSISAFPILPYIIRSILILLIFTSSVFYFINRSRVNVKISKTLILTLIPFIFLFISLIYSEDITRGLKRLIQMSAFLILPLAFFFIRKPITKDELNKSLNIFVFSVFLLVLYQIINSLFSLDLIFSYPTEIELKSLNIAHELTDSEINQIKLRRFRIFVTELTDTHPTYQGLWIVFSLAIIFLNIIKTKHKFIKYMWILPALIIFSWLILISSRSPLIGLITGGLIVFILKFNNQLKLRSIIYLGLAIFFVLSIIYKTLPGFKEKADEVFYTKIELPTSGKDIYNFNATNVRYGIYYCSLVLVGENIFTGVGIGDMQNSLNNCYGEKIGSKIYGWNDYNTHNQYIFFWLASGVFGMIFFIIFLAWCFKIATKQRNYLYLFFIVSISVIFLTENVLSRNDGLIYFAFFNSIFLIYSKSDKYDCG